MGPTAPHKDKLICTECRDNESPYVPHILILECRKMLQTRVLELYHELGQCNIPFKVTIPKALDLSLEFVQLGHQLCHIGHFHLLHDINHLLPFEWDGGSEWHDRVKLEFQMMITGMSALTDLNLPPLKWD